MEASKSQFAKAVFHSQKIFLGTQAISTFLNRWKNHGPQKGTTLKGRLSTTLNDLDVSINEFEKITGIELGDAKQTLAQCLSYLEQENVASLHESIQKLYREDYLNKIIELSK